MSEQSFLFDFTRVDDFFEQINVGFNIPDDMYVIKGYDESTGKYIYNTNYRADGFFELVLIQYGDTNIDSYLTPSGELDTSQVTGIMTKPCILDWYNKGYGEAEIRLHEPVKFEIGEENIPLRAILLRQRVTGYVLGYSINNVPFSLTNEIVFDDDVIFWDISRFNNGG